MARVSRRGAPIPSLLEQESTQELDLSERGLAGIDFRLHPLLRAVNLSNNALKKIEHLDSLRAVERLDLSHNLILRMEGLLALSQLRELHLQGNSISRIEGIAGCPNLEVLNLSENELTVLEGLEFCTKLLSLNVSYNSIVEIRDLRGLASLQALDISGNLLESVEPLQRNLPSKLRTLLLAENRIVDFIDLKYFSHLSLLEILDLSENPFHKDVVAWGIEYRAFLISILPKIQYLNGAQVTPSEQAVAERLFTNSKGKFTDSLTSLLSGGKSDALVGYLQRECPLAPEARELYAYVPEKEKERRMHREPTAFKKIELLRRSVSIVDNEPDVADSIPTPSGFALAAKRALPQASTGSTGERPMQRSPTRRVVAPPPNEAHTGSPMQSASRPPVHPASTEEELDSGGPVSSSVLPAPENVTASPIQRDLPPPDPSRTSAAEEGATGVPMPPPTTADTTSREWSVELGMDRGTPPVAVRSGMKTQEAITGRSSHMTPPSAEGGRRRRGEAEVSPRRSHRHRRDHHDHARRSATRRSHHRHKDPKNPLGASADLSQSFESPRGVASDTTHLQEWRDAQTRGAMPPSIFMPPGPMVDPYGARQWFGYPPPPWVFGNGMGMGGAPVPGLFQDPREPVSAPVSARGPMEAPRASHREGASRGDSKKRREARAPGSAEKPAFVSKAEFHILEEKMREMRKFYRLLLRQEISKRERAVIKMQAVARGYLVRRRLGLHKRYPCITRCRKILEQRRLFALWGPPAPSITRFSGRYLASPDQIALYRKLPRSSLMDRTESKSWSKLGLDRRQTIKAQSIVRGFVVRLRLARYRQQHAAATKIQALWRGFRWRRLLAYRQRMSSQWNSHEQPDGHCAAGAVKMSPSADSQIVFLQRQFMRLEEILERERKERSAQDEAFRYLWEEVKTLRKRSDQWENQEKELILLRREAVERDAQIQELQLSVERLQTSIEGSMHRSPVRSAGTRLQQPTSPKSPDTIYGGLPQKLGSDPQSPRAVPLLPLHRLGREREGPVGEEQLLDSQELPAPSRLPPPVPPDHDVVDSESDVDVGVEVASVTSVGSDAEEEPVSTGQEQHTADVGAEPASSAAPLLRPSSLRARMASQVTAGDSPLPKLSQVPASLLSRSLPEEVPQAHVQAPFHASSSSSSSTSSTATAARTVAYGSTVAGDSSKRYSSSVLLSSGRLRSSSQADGERPTPEMTLQRLRELRAVSLPHSSSSGTSGIKGGESAATGVSSLANESLGWRSPRSLSTSEAQRRQSERARAALESLGINITPTRNRPPGPGSL